MEHNVQMDTSGGDESRHIALLNLDPQVSEGGPPIDRFSALQQEEAYYMLPPPAKSRSTLYKDEMEPGFISRQKFTVFVAWLKEGISPATRGGVTSPFPEGVSSTMPHGPSRKSTSLKPSKGDTEVSIYYCDGMNGTCMGVVGNNAQVCAVGAKLYRFAHLKKVMLHTGW